MDSIEKVCWNITSECNKNCRYCFKFCEENLSYEDNYIILKKLFEMGVNEIVWSGGEPLLYENIIELLKNSRDRGICNTVITNASLLNKNNLDKYLKYIDQLIVSLDFVNDYKNLENGIGFNYYKHLSEILGLMKKANKEVLVQVNTVVFKENYQHIRALMLELEKYNIDRWKIIRFVPIRGKSLTNQDNLSITDKQFDEVLKEIDSIEKKFEVIINDNSDILKTHYIVLSSGKFVKSENGKDVLVGYLK